jgi:hypothetical protein
MMPEHVARLYKRDNSIVETFGASWIIKHNANIRNKFKSSRLSVCVFFVPLSACKQGIAKKRYLKPKLIEI